MCLYNSYCVAVNINTNMIQNYEFNTMGFKSTMMVLIIRSLKFTSY